MGPIPEQDVELLQNVQTRSILHYGPVYVICVDAPEGGRMLLPSTYSNAGLDAALGAAEHYADRNPIIYKRDRHNKFGRYK